MVECTALQERAARGEVLVCKRLDPFHIHIHLSRNMTSRDDCALEKTVVFPHIDLCDSLCTRGFAVNPQLQENLQAGSFRLGVFFFATGILPNA